MGTRCGARTRFCGSWKSPRHDADTGHARDYSRHRGNAWPWLSKIGFGRLPGDIVIERENFRFYFPITSMILVSLLLSLIFWLFRK